MTDFAVIARAHPIFELGRICALATESQKHRKLPGIWDQRTPPTLHLQLLLTFKKKDSVFL